MDEQNESPEKIYVWTGTNSWGIYDAGGKGIPYIRADVVDALRYELDATNDQAIADIKELRQENERLRLALEVKAHSHGS